MADKPGENNIINENDTLDINELATLNEDISAEFIEKLQLQVTEDANAFNNGQQNSELFEEVENTEADNTTPASVPETTEDDFTKKYQEKLRASKLQPNPQKNQEETTEEVTNTVEEAPSQEMSESTIVSTTDTPKEEPIENVTGGNIVEKPITKDQTDYNASLDYIDGNTKYSKYVIYISPENKDFIDSLTVKERKNLINKIIREQDDIVVTKHKLGTLQTILRHAIIAIITLAIAIPITYLIINLSLEASIDNYRRSQGMFQTLYREHGKVVNTKGLN